VNCKTIRETLPAYHDGEVPETVARNIEDHLTLCHLCRKVDVSLKDAWNMLGAWEDSDPAEKIRMGILSHRHRQRKMRWIKIVVPIAAAFFLVIGVIFRLAELQLENHAQMPLFAAPMQLSAEHPEVDEDELIADLHVLQDEEFYDTVEELVKIDYLPLIDETKQEEKDRQSSSLDEALA